MLTAVGYGIIASFFSDINDLVHSPIINIVYGFQPLSNPPSNTSQSNLSEPQSPPQQQFQPSQSNGPPFNSEQSTSLANKTSTLNRQLGVEREPPANFQSKGTINSLIRVPQTKWIATGNWFVTVNSKHVTDFRTNMSWFDEKGTATHTHEFLNFKTNQGVAKEIRQIGNNTIIRGLMDVGTNQKIVWKDVPTTIVLKGEKTITISAADKATNQHFAAQPILGVIKSFMLCSDQPGPDMVILPSCS